MKKTIIAAAVAASVAAPAAFADVKISGMVNPEFADYDVSEFTGDVADDGKFGSVNTDLVFSGSEDLGNGMKASFKYHLFHDDGTQNSADHSVSLSGDFGTITAGRFEPFVEGKFDAFANIDPSHDLDLEGINVLSRGSVANGGLAYVSPSMNGLSIGVSNVMNGDTSDANEVLVSYANNGLTAMVIRSEADGATSATDTDTTGLAVGYKMGALELRAMTRDGETAGVDHEYSMIGAKFTAGSNTFAIGYAEEEGADEIAGVDVAVDGEYTIFSAEHKLSKSTSVYVAYMDVEAEATATAGAVTAGDSADADALLFGIKQSF